VGDGVMNPVSSFMKTRIPYLTYDPKILNAKIIGENTTITENSNNKKSLRVIRFDGK
jgi:hypothetical protein